MKAFVVGEDRRADYTEGLPEQVVKGSDLFIAVQEDDDPVGLAAFRAEGDVFLLMWIYVREEYRQRGAGTLLMGAAKDILRDAGADSLQAIYTLNDDTAVLHDFLEEQQMRELTEESRPVFSFCYGDIDDRYRGKKAVRTEKLSEVNEGRWTYYVSEYYKTAEQEGSEVLPIGDKAMYDPELSIVQADEKKNITGLILISRSGDDLVLEHLSTKEKGDVSKLLELLQAAIDGAEGKVKPEAKLSFCAVNDKINKLAESISGNKLLQTGISVIQVYEF